MIVRANLIEPASTRDPLIDGGDQLISVFVTTINAARENR